MVQTVRLSASTTPLRSMIRPLAALMVPFSLVQIFCFLAIITAAKYHRKISRPVSPDITIHKVRHGMAILRL